MKYIKNRYSAIIGLTFYLLFTTVSRCQSPEYLKANNAYEHTAYAKAIEYYTNAFDAGFRNQKLLTRLGNAYYFNSDYKSAAIWYKEVVKTRDSLEPIYNLRYAQSLFSMGKKEEGKKYFQFYLKQIGEGNRDIDSLFLEPYDDKKIYIYRLNFNTRFDDFGASLTDNRIIFSSSRSENKKNKKNSWNGKAFLDLYESNINPSGYFNAPQRISGDINSEFHESTAVITKDGKIMYFTRNVLPRKENRRDTLLRLHIFKSEKINGKWTNIQKLSINGDDFSTAHPALSPNEDRLFFASNRPGSIGQTDIFYADILPDGSFGEVTSLGDKVNTIGRESFPFVSNQNELFFSSDGHYGYGGFDIFYLNTSERDSLQLPINMGKPINSNNDDIGFSIYGSKGYLSSDRPGGYGLTDIYSFKNLDLSQYTLKNKIYGFVKDRASKEILPNTKILIKSLNSSKVDTIFTDVNGYYEFEPTRKHNYLITVTERNHEGSEKLLYYKSEDQKVDFELEKIDVGFAVGDDLASLFNIILYFETDSYAITPSAKSDLLKLIRFMKKYPELRLFIKCHTDSRGNSDYNQVLSDKRAQAIKQFMVDQGIETDRLQESGFGESKILNRCFNNIPCSEEEHSLNRRVEFEVITNGDK